MAVACLLPHSGEPVLLAPLPQGKIKFGGWCWDLKHIQNKINLILQSGKEAKARCK